MAAAQKRARVVSGQKSTKRLTKTKDEGGGLWWLKGEGILREGVNGGL